MGRSRQRIRADGGINEGGGLNGEDVLTGTMKNNNKRHYIIMISVDKKYRGKGLAQEMLQMVRESYGGDIQHSNTLTKHGRKFRDRDVEARGTPAVPLLASGREPEDFDRQVLRAARGVVRSGAPRSRGTRNNSVQASTYIATNPRELKNIISSNAYAKKAKNGGHRKAARLLDDIQVRWDLQQNLSESVDRVMRSSKGMAGLVEEFGMPPIFFFRLSSSSI